MYLKLISRAATTNFLLASHAGDPPLYLCRMFKNFPSFRGLYRKVLHILETFFSPILKKLDSEMLVVDFAPRRTDLV